MNSQPSSPGPNHLFEMFEAHARAAPQRTLIRSVDGGFTLNAAALAERVHGVARALKDDGVMPGDLVLIAGLSGAGFAVAQLAVWARDAASVAADAQLAGAELADLSRCFDPCAVIGPGGAILEPRVTTPASGARRSSDGHGRPADTALVKLTSGSTGRPRGIAVTAAQLLADARHIATGMDITPDDVCIAAIALSHSYGMANILMQMVAQGSPMLIVPAPLPDMLAEALSIDEPSIFAGVPYLFELLARENGPAVRRRGLRTCLSAAAPLRPGTAAAFHEKIGLPVRAFYGTSETGGITYDASAAGDAAATADGCVGAPLPGVSLTLEGEERRVVVAGGAVASGYVGHLDHLGHVDEPGQADDAAFAGGVFRTGDTGRLDESGRLHLTGRISALVNVSGRKVNPREIERALLCLHGVGDAAVMGVSDGVRGESLVAFLTHAADGSGLTREKVIAHLRDGLAPYKIPRRVIFLQELPRGPRGKLDHETLRRLAREEVESA